MREQARTAHEMAIGVSNISQDVLRVANANRNHLAAADNIRSSVSELRQITTRNADGVNATLTSTSGLANSARELGQIMDSIVSSKNLAANGNEAGTSRAGSARRRKKTPAETKSES
jgi:methyl-accepting chemotaxis protein